MSERRLLVAGIGNIFLGDDAFGVEVVQQLAARAWPAGVEVVDFGIRGFDLACALPSGYDAVILVDCLAPDGEPGTLRLIKPETETDAGAISLTPHHLDPVAVLRLVRAMGGKLPRMLLVGCVPASLEPINPGEPLLSSPVAEAVPRAIALVESLVERWQEGLWKGE